MLLLSGVLPLVEDAEALQVLLTDMPAGYSIFSTDADTHPTKGVKDISAGRTALRALTEVILQV